MTASTTGSAQVTEVRGLQDALPPAGRREDRAVWAASLSVAARGHRLTFTHHTWCSHRGRPPFASCVNSAEPVTAARERAGPGAGLFARDDRVCSGPASRPGQASQAAVIASLRVRPWTPHAYIIYLYKTRMYTFTDAGLGNCIALTYTMALACHRPRSPRSS